VNFFDFAWTRSGAHALATGKQTQCFPSAERIAAAKLARREFG